MPEAEPPKEWSDPAAHLVNDRTRLALRIQQRLLQELRRILDEDGYVEFLAPILGPVTDPGIRGAKQATVDYYGHTYRVMSSGILYKQAALNAHDRIYFNAPNVRLEPPETATTGRHLAEFYQLDIETANADYHQAMDLAEKLVAGAANAAADAFADDLAAVDYEPVRLKPPFPRRSHADVVQELKGAGRDQDEAAEIRWPEEQWLSQQTGNAFFVYDYPKGSRGFYDKEDPERPGVLRDFDLILPGGYGEVVSGAERESEYAKLIARMRETGENPAKYGWYIRMIKQGIPPSAGFGIGVERLTRYVAGVDAVWRARPWPKLPGHPCP